MKEKKKDVLIKWNIHYYCYFFFVLPNFKSGNTKKINAFKKKSIRKRQAQMNI